MIKNIFILYFYKGKMFLSKNVPCDDERTHQSHPSHHRDTVNTLQAEVEQAGDHDDQVENIPAVGEILFAQSSQLQNSFEQEECGENLERR